MMMEVEVTAVPALAALHQPLGGLASGFGFVWLEVRADLGVGTLKPIPNWLLPNDQPGLKW